MKHIFYHALDFDGFCSGAVTKYKLLQDGCSETDIQLHPYVYECPFPYDSIKEKDELFFVDVVVQPYSEMIEIYNKYDTTIIDHHKTFIDFISTQILKGRQETGLKAACELCWEYFFPDIDTPNVVKLLSAYDAFNKSDIGRWENVIFPFQYGMRAQNISPISNWGFWKALFNSEPEDEDRFIFQTIQNGLPVIEYQKQIDVKILEAGMFEATFDGLKAVCCNTNFQNTLFFESRWDEDKYDLMIAFNINKNQIFSISLYTTKKDINVGELAKNHGGGGHPKAAGFTCKNFLVEEGVIYFNN